MKRRACRSRNLIKLAAVLAALASMLLVGVAANAQTQSGKPVYVADEYIIHVKSGTTESQVKQMVDKLGATVTSTLAVKDYYVVKLGRNGASPTLTDTSAEFRAPGR